MIAEKTAVVFVSPSFGRGENGPGTYATYLWEGFRDDPEVEFHIVAPWFSASHPRWHPAGSARNSWSLYRKLSSKALEVARSLPQGRIILHVNICHLDTLLLKAGFPVFGQVNDYENAEIFQRWREVFRQQGLRRCVSLLLRRRREQRFVEGQALTICNSAYTRQAVLKAYTSAAPERIVAIYKSVDLEFYRRPSVLAPDPLRRDQRRLQLVFIGTDFVRKGLDLLLRAMPGFSREAELVVIGPTREQVQRRYPELAGNKQISSMVRYAGRIEKELLREILWHSDVLVLPSRAEAFGVAILEAAAAGLQIIGTRVGGIPEILEGMSGAQLIAAESSDEIAFAVRKVLAFSPRGISANGTVEAFSKSRMLNKIRQLYISHLRQ